MTTLATFYGVFRDMALTDVTSLNQPPQSVETADIPAKWVDSAGIDEAPLRAKGTGGERTIRCRVVVLMGPPTQETQTNRWSDTLAMVDTLNAGIKSVADRTTTWTIDATPNLDGSGYFAAFATVSQAEFKF